MRWHNKDGRMRVLFGPQGADCHLNSFSIQKVAKKEIPRSTCMYSRRQRDLSDREEIRQETYGILDDLGYLDSTSSLFT